MKTGMAAALLALALASCMKPADRTGEETPAPLAATPPPATPMPLIATPPPTAAAATLVPPTPHPAEGATARAMQLYPDLAKKGSMFNKTFLDLFEYRKKADPKSLTKVDWPLELASRTAATLGVKPARESTPAPVAVVRHTPAPYVVAATKQSSADGLQTSSALGAGHTRTKDGILWQKSPDGKYWRSVKYLSGGAVRPARSEPVR